MNIELIEIIMEFSKYIVPIYAGSTLIGSGVLHNSLLVTAAHVVDFCIRGRNFAFQYNSKVYILGWKDKLFFEYDEIKRLCGTNYLWH